MLVLGAGSGPLQPPCGAAAPGALPSWQQNLGKGGKSPVWGGDPDATSTAAPPGGPELAPTPQTSPAHSSVLHHMLCIG